MRLASRSGRVFLFVGAVLLPSAVLLAATVRLAFQERELEARRREERRTLLATSLAQELLTRLEQLRTQVLQARPSHSAMTEANPALVLVAQLRAGRLVFPWDEVFPRARRAESPPPEYARLLAAGEAAEFARAQFAEAAALYRRAGAEAADSIRRGEAWLREARALVRSGRGEAARARYLQLAKFPPSARDDEGMPLALYAAEGLLQAGVGGPEDARGALDALTQARKTLGPTALYALRELAAGADANLGQAIARWIAIVERASTLEHDLPGLLAPTPGDGSAVTPPRSPWFPVGSGPWLVSAQPASEARGGIVVVAAPAALLESLATEGGPLAAAARSVRLTGAGQAGTEDLGPMLPGLRAAFTDLAVIETSGPRLGPRLFLFVLPAVAGLTLFGAWLFWRDLRREVATAELRSQIVSSVSHELKTPLTSIRMFAETLLLGRQPQEEVRREYLETILHESERLTRHINNVLDFSRMDAGQQQYHFAPTDLGDVVRDSAQAISYPLSQGGFELALNLPDTPPVVSADRDALTRAVLNLLSNAMKFSGERRTIELSLAVQNGDALVRVRDWGRGIAPRERERIFERYYRAPDVEDAKITGTGLGLPLVAHVVHAHGGRVDLESVAGEGSTFTIRLPLGRSA